MSTATIRYLLVSHDFSGSFQTRNSRSIGIPDSATVDKLADEIKLQEELPGPSSKLNVWKLVRGVTGKAAKKETFFSELKRYHNDDDDGEDEEVDGTTKRKAMARYPHGHCAWRVSSGANVKLLVGDKLTLVYVLIQAPLDEGMSYPLYLGMVSLFQL
jgi:hypothetical protein